MTSTLLCLTGNNLHAHHHPRRHCGGGKRASERPHSTCGRSGVSIAYVAAEPWAAVPAAAARCQGLCVKEIRSRELRHVRTDERGGYCGRSCGGCRERAPTWTRRLSMNPVHWIASGGNCWAMCLLGPPARLAFIYVSRCVLDVSFLSPSPALAAVLIRHNLILSSGM